MFNPFNPYSPITEEKFFFGEKRIEEAINMAGQIEKNGYSYVVLAGDKMGKTSFLIRLNDILQRISLKKPGLLTLYVNLSHMMPLTPYNFLQGILSSTLKELKRDSEFNELQDKDYRLREGDDIKSLFDDFIDHKLKYLLREGEEVYGKIRLVLLIDDGKHLVTGQEWSEAMYHQLRYLFVDSPLSSKICSVMTGFRKIRDLRDRVGSPFNHMQSRFLEGFSEKDCRLILEKSLINSGKGEIDLKEDLLSKIHNLTGGHPFILTNLYSLLWDKIPPLNMFTIDETIEEIHTLESNFQRWNQKLDAYDREIYSYLIKQKDWIEGGYFKDKFKSRWRDSIEVLSSMSLINNMRKDNNIYYNTTFSLFREWFVNFFPLKEITEEQMEIDKQIPPSGEKNIKFFVYKNGIRNILKIDHCRKIIEEAYKKTGSFNFVIDRVFSEGSIIDRNRGINITLPGKIGMDLLVHLAINRGVFQSFPQIGYALWQEEFVPKINIQNVKSLLGKELSKKGIKIDELILSRRGGYMFNEEIDVCVITNAIIRCSKCGNPSDINMNGGRCTNSVCNASLM